MPSTRRRKPGPNGKVGGAYLESAAARQFDPKEIDRLTEEEAVEVFVAARWIEHGGKPVCPHCAHDRVYDMIINRRLKAGVKKVRLFKCAACRRQFSPTSGTPYAHHKLDLRDYLYGMNKFMTGVKGRAALDLSRQMNVQAKTAFVLAHKIREALLLLRQSDLLCGEVEVDGAWFGGRRRKTNLVSKRRHDPRVKKDQQSAVVIRQRGGETRALVFPAEQDSVSWVIQNIDPSAKVFTDDAPHWNALHAYFDVKTINHTKHGFWTPEASTNEAESVNSRFRRAQYGVYHRIAGRHLAGYVAELAWRENGRRQSMGEHWRLLLHAVTHSKPSREWTGYWNYAGTGRSE